MPISEEEYKKLKIRQIGKLFIRRWKKRIIAISFTSIVWLDYRIYSEIQKLLLQINKYTVKPILKTATIMNKAIVKTDSLFGGFLSKKGIIDKDGSGSIQLLNSTFDTIYKPYFMPTLNTILLMYFCFHFFLAIKFLKADYLITLKEKNKSQYFFKIVIIANIILPIILEIIFKKFHLQSFIIFIPIILGIALLAQCIVFLISFKKI